MRIFLIVYLSAIPLASAFLPNIFQHPGVIRPDLLQVTDNQKDTKLNIQLCIGRPDESQIPISGLVIELHHELASDYEHVALPGADGPNRHLSSGCRRLDVLSEGHFVSLQGTEHIKTLKGCWEMCWVKGKPAGSLVCGFEIPQEYKRNSATLPESNMYVSFPIWTAEGLKIGQHEKRIVLDEAQQYLEQRDEEMSKYEMTDNPILEALFLHNAQVAVDKYNGLPHETLESIPDDHEVFHLQDGLLLNMNGRIWAKEKHSKESGHVFLGYAKVCPEMKNQDRLMP